MRYVVLATVTLCAFPQAADAQLRSLHAIRYVTLAPAPPGLEKLHLDLANSWRQETKLVETPDTLESRLARGETFDRLPSLWIDPRVRAARCRLRNDLPPPRSTGLECSDFAGNYVGVIRFASADALRNWIRRELQFNLAAARPLTTVRGLSSGQSRRPGVSTATVDLLKELLRKEGTFAVFESEEAVPADQRETVVWFDFHPAAYIENGTTVSRLDLKDRFGNLVRRFEVARSGSVEATMRLLIEQVLAARREDQDIYRVPPPD